MLFHNKLWLKRTLWCLMTMQIYPDLIPIFLQRINGFCAFLTHSFATLHLINFVWNFDYNFWRFGRNYRKNYRKPIYRHLFNYRQNYRYRKMHQIWADKYTQETVIKKDHSLPFDFADLFWFRANILEQGQWYCI